MGERNEGPNEAGQWGAMPPEQPGPGEAETEGQRFRFRAFPEDTPGGEGEPSSGETGEDEVEGHGRR
jgi:hypothetical protein